MRDSGAVLSVGVASGPLLSSRNGTASRPALLGERLRRRRRLIRWRPVLGPPRHIRRNVGAWCDCQPSGAVFIRGLDVTLQCVAGPLSYLGAVHCIHANAAEPSPVMLALFCGSVGGIMSSFGGSVALRPPICGDLFGNKSVGLMSAYQLSVVMPASFFGPQLVASLRQRTIDSNIHDLAALTDDRTFEQVKRRRRAPLPPPSPPAGQALFPRSCSQLCPLQAFGAPPEQLDLLIETKVVTINRLLQILPPDTVRCRIYIRYTVLWKDRGQSRGFSRVQRKIGTQKRSTRGGGQLLSAAWLRLHTALSDIPRRVLVYPTAASVIYTPPRPCLIRQVDPTPFSYDTVLYVMAVLYAGAFATNMMVTPLDPSLHAKPVDARQ